MRHSVLIYFFIFFIGVSLIGGSVFTTYSQFVGEGPLPERTEVVVPRGSLKKIANVLYENGIINSPSIFVLGVRASGNTHKIKSGEYSIPRRASAKMVMNILVSGNTYIRRVVIPEGLTSSQVIDILNEAKGLIGVVSQVPKNGTLLPETYHYSYGDTKERMIIRMQNAMTRVLDEAWEKRMPNLPIKNKHEAIILASIVEKETSLDSERTKVAGVFINRLNKKMRLQSDPTIIYAVTDGRMDLKRSLKAEDRKINHPYNTYVVPALPAGPIANPGKRAIEAVLNPAQTDALYFVATGKGGHAFAKTYKEHLKNIDSWLKVLKEQRRKKR
ncbi:MAG: endolytic transglycosylase MltG [Alphaproteobacteria bacterium]|nr:endolytic transglycosylase MltG [Alphaproteobacteria bacterium]